MHEVEDIKSLTEEGKEDTGLTNAIEKGFTGKFTEVEVLQKKLRG